MPTIAEYYEFAKLTTASYIIFDDKSLNGESIAQESNLDNRLPTSLADKMFVQNPETNPGSVWTIPEGGYYGNDDTGFAATLFEKDGQKVLAIRGTEGGGGALDIYQDLLISGLAQIGFIGFALSQTVSMINYIQRLSNNRGQTTFL